MNIDLLLEFIRRNTSAVTKHRAMLIRASNDCLDILPKDLSDRIWAKPLSNTFPFGIAHLH